MKLLGQLDRAGIEEAAVMLTLGKLSRLSATPTSGPLVCANASCEHVLTMVGDDRPRGGRCERCYRYKSRNDRDWTPRAVESA